MGSLERLASKAVNGDSIEILRRRCGEVIANSEGDHWSGSPGAWREAISAVMNPSYGLSYPQLTDWVRAQPSGAALLVVTNDDALSGNLKIVDVDYRGKVVTMIVESELSPVSFGYGDDYQAVWLSRHVDPSCEAKIPRGVKVYRER